jgi:hypothetical protein
MRSNGHPRLLRHGTAHELTRRDRAKGGRARAEKIRKRKELSDRFHVETLKEFDEADRELLDQPMPTKRRLARKPRPEDTNLRG